MYESYRRYHTLNYMDVYFSRASHRGKTVAEVATNTGIRSFEKWLEESPNVPANDVQIENKCFFRGVILSNKDDENKKINAAEFVAECMFEIFSIIRKKENVIEEYKNRSMLIGETVTVTPVVGVNKTDFKAKIISITDDAGLEVELENGNREVLHCGEISLHNNL